jgi:hypothetical protein
MENAVIVRLGPVGALTLNSFSNCFVLSAVSARATSMGIELARTALGSPPTYTERVLSADLDFVVAAISCLFPPSAMSNAGSGAVAVALMAAMQRGVALGAAGQVVILTTPNVVAYAVSGGGSSGTGARGGSHSAGGPKNAADAFAEGLSVRRGVDIGIARPPRHHLFAQELRAFFAERGFHDIDNYTIALDRATHEAIHKWMGSGPWNEVLRTRILTEEAVLGRLLTRREILDIGAKMRREAGLSHIKIIPFQG